MAATQWRRQFVNIISFGIFGLFDDTFICITVNANPLKTNNCVSCFNDPRCDDGMSEGEKPAEMFMFSFNSHNMFDVRTDATNRTVPLVANYTTPGVYQFVVVDKSPKNYWNRFGFVKPDRQPGPVISSTCYIPSFRIPAEQSQLSAVFSAQHASGKLNFELIA